MREMSSAEFMDFAEEHHRDTLFFVIRPWAEQKAKREGAGLADTWMPRVHLRYGTKSEEIEKLRRKIIAAIERERATK